MRDTEPVVGDFVRRERLVLDVVVDEPDGRAVRLLWEVRLQASHQIVYGIVFGVGVVVPGLLLQYTDYGND